MTPNTPPNINRTDHRTGSTVAEAARVLGLTTDAVRMRLKRGSLAGEKRGAEWVVWLPETEQATEHHRTSTDQTPEQPTEHDGPSWATLLAAKDDALAAKTEEIAFLRDQLDKRSRELADERERSDVLHREAFARIEALTAGLSTNVDTDPDDVTGADDDDSLAPARVRARENAGKPSESPQDDDVAPGTATASDLTDDE